MSQGPNQLSPLGQVEIQGLIGTSVKWPTVNIRILHGIRAIIANDIK
jgi:hypothetical protein